MHNIACKYKRAFIVWFHDGYLNYFDSPRGPYWYNVTKNIYLYHKHGDSLMLFECSRTFENITWKCHLKSRRFQLSWNVEFIPNNLKTRVHATHKLFDHINVGLGFVYLFYQYDYKFFAKNNIILGHPVLISGAKWTNALKIKLKVEELHFILIHY